VIADPNDPGEMLDEMNGGPAFPCDVFDPAVRGPEQWEGMSLRDYFAARAMQAITSVLHKGIRPAALDAMAHDAYGIADAMLKARRS
jgi:hypothetical protein